ALSLKKELFPIRWGKFATKYYININKLVNANNTGFRQKIEPYETEIFDKTNAMIEVWRTNGKVDKNDIIANYKWSNDLISKMYLDEFHIDILK
ncbi:MAG: hypothetical protein U9Q83_01080, partial [Bacteroidota bacterium]|nr:hypothetical protein [Bacteroidota bacterium]